ncbi:unnamed protein product [Rhizoctonia solani]|nr:unnamed protein product [Rhizoctonia solani]
MAIVDSDQPEATYLTVTYDPFGQGTTIHAAVIPLTNNYTVALTSAQEALQKHFPHGSSTRPRWLAIPVKTLTTAGFSWAEISPKLFPEIIKKPGIELRLCEDHRHVNILPFGNDGNTSYRFKVITIGNSSVGKSMMLQHFTKPEGSRSDALPVTLGVHPDVSTRFMTAQGARLKVVLWDTAGQEHYRSIVTSYFRRANGVFLVYSVTNRPSFLACQNWLKDLYNNIGGPHLQNVPIMLIGNQIDLGHLRKVTTSEGEAFALNNGLLFAEVSAKEGTGVEYAFQNLVEAMVDTRQLLEVIESDPLGATAPERPQPSHSPSLPPYSPGLGKSRLLTVIYTPSGDADATLHTALVPWTNDYQTALSAAKEAFEQYFPPNSAQRRRWLTTRVQTSSGITWAEFQPALFSQVVGELGVELQLCEDRPHKLDVTVLPIGHEQTTADGESYYQFKIITIGQRSVGKSMMLQYFTRPEEERLDTLSSTVGPSMDIADRFMTAHGELVKTVLWDTAGQETFRAMTKPLYRGSHGVFLVYSIADAESFNNCADWLTEIRGHVDEHAPIMLVGNQIDRAEQRAVATNDAQAFATEHGLLFAEISGKYGTNVENAFQKLVHEIFNRLKDRDQLYTCKETKQSARSRKLPVGPEEPWHQRARNKCC